MEAKNLKMETENRDYTLLRLVEEFPKFREKKGPVGGSSIF